ncbi:mitogen-activated protein kinase kinase kinase 1-like [Olea europaea var. sylvestris]|uniref:mitogen-activated protein kinase kinase kinase n=1 Tax=Olea europaea subsp. europaea TaxID=158383 RepID=A0A8S0QKS4_OLEEU|nr:mitogen-activated protein kinase kinase kinase 1-like [Olea europaea var. sylvestris]XP_022887936.1 mitogen-activated protein kinase kinase kinase 1-like [Olea europaea var. sylvestris]XP_022887937.1 mitogen-activated protein kinase kinase kinase 1-like [Olea europaea var. sylvestris]CAA2966865.1 mitogen-activated kinase kinase kinase 1-like [Olea europaea subsp. europaea]
MHRIPKIFIHSSERRKTRSKSGSTSSTSSISSPSRQSDKPIPRLERLNAVKNIDYDYLPSTSSTSALSASCSSEESLRRRSRDFCSRQTSLRIEGVDGQFEFMCETLGFSGIDDFGIPVEEYEAMKIRSSVASSLISQKNEDSNGNILSSGSILNSTNQKIEDCISSVTEVSGPSSNKVVEVINPKFVCNGIEDLVFSNIGRGSSLSIISRGDDDGLCELSKRLENSARISNLVFSHNASGKLGEICRNGIKGERPPVLAPPPAISLPAIDNECSTWDILKSFAPDCDKSFSKLERGFGSEEDEQETEIVGGRRDDDEENYMSKKRIMMREENGVLSGSCSFTTTSNDDDSSSSTTEPTSYVSPNGRFKRIIVDWQKGELLGCGSFGSVYEGIADDGFFFAVKEVSLLDQGDEGKQRIIQLEQEIALLSQFEHENIVQYYGTQKVESHLYIFLELVTKGSLLSLYQKYNLRDSLVSAYTRQILHGLKYLHDKNVVHRDIKCANILVDASGSVKLADFGLAKAIKLNDVKSCKGTPFWMAPEVVRSLGYGLAADIWSLGCTVLEMLTRHFPYSSMEPMSALYRIGRGELPSIPDSLSSDARNFILKCLQVDASARPTASELLDHPFVKRPLPASSGSASPYNFGQRI